ncbi:pyridoxal phosphate-dependent aminotransferase [Advenella mimigardefordensis]|uniref:Aminotransferase n=1 Tax=Advenella mimigardefordensis (strain DSM 17166 / LMG 22922 / DPN7) TaxID=1247726 RepID=W0PBF9_ADVMD|nr:pyridoxal phosphate-dependent aminotransferase [Advenella mimigardefordensis]AHG64076.1 aspartate aminotransferase [Advenella mimigardefordensis DPN7]
MMNHAQRLNRFLAGAKSSATYAIMDRVAQKRAVGDKVISLSAGEPDFGTPAHIRSAAISAIQSGYTRYSQVAGLRPLREAIAEKFQVENGIQTDWRNTIVCNGGKQVIFNALASTLNEADEVIVPAPYWVSYPEMVQVCGGTPILVQCDAGSSFKLTPQALEKAITERTRWLILNSPSNPSGAVYSEDELRALATVLMRHPQVLILSDDIYEHLVFDDKAFFTLAQIAPQLHDRILTMNGVSKAYAMTGWRIGFGAGPAWLINAMEKLQGQQTSGACTISQYAAIAALAGPKDFIHQSRDVFQQRRDNLVGYINQIPGLQCDIPSGAFYGFIACRDWIGRTTRSGTVLKSDDHVVSALLDEANVATVHGSAFGLGPYIRISYALDDAPLVDACEAISKFRQAFVE